MRSNLQSAITEVNELTHYKYLDLCFTFVEFNFKFFKSITLNLKGKTRLIFKRNVKTKSMVHTDN